MAELTDASIPKFAAGCRWGGRPMLPSYFFRKARSGRRDGTHHSGTLRRAFHAR